MIRTPDGAVYVPTIGMEVTHPSPEELAGFLARRAVFDKNVAWFEAHVTEIRQQCAGQYICVAGETLFSNEDPKEMLDRARAAFPGEWGSFFTMYLNPQR